MASGRDGDYSQLGFEETELRLGLSCGDGEAVKATGKRGFSETIHLELKLKLTTAVDVVDGAGVTEKLKRVPNQGLLACEGTDPEKPPIPKAQVVGWPPVRSFRKNILSVKPSNKDDREKSGGASAAFVKVSMDGMPYLRKVDLKMFRSYQELSMALEKMFGFFTSGNCGSQLRHFMNENKLMDLLNGYVPIYEDKDKDWMLVGDVPWEMFVDSCKRLRIMKGSEAIGLAPSAMEKCKNKS